jgi:hypothetical protein
MRVVTLSEGVNAETGPRTHAFGLCDLSGQAGLDRHFSGLRLVCGHPHVWPDVGVGEAASQMVEVEAWLLGVGNTGSR